MKHALALETNVYKFFLWGLQKLGKSVFLNTEVFLDGNVLQVEFSSKENILEPVTPYDFIFPQINELQKMRTSVQFSC